MSSTGNTWKHIDASWLMDRQGEFEALQRYELGNEEMEDP